jgi:hypothetical protein
MILKIFSLKKLAFFAQTSTSFWKFFTLTLVFEKMPSESSTISFAAHVPLEAAVYLYIWLHPKDAPMPFNYEIFFKKLNVSLASGYAFC